MPSVTSQSFFSKLQTRINKVDSLLCIGLDPNLDQIPDSYIDPDIFVSDQLLAWNFAIIEATAPYACAYKPNIAFYEALGPNGYSMLKATLEAIPEDIPVILDAKRSDIGNTAAAYARAVFRQLGADAVTLNPYLGRDSIEPFIKYSGKGLFILCHTSRSWLSGFPGA